MRYTSGFHGRLFNDHLLLGFIPYERRRHCHLDLPAEEAGEQSEVVDSILASSTCLCPRLEVLNVLGAGCSKQIFLEFLNSRLVDHDKYGISRLRRFMISSSDRELEEGNLKEEIDGLIEKSGLLMKLEHFSVPSPTLPPPWFSPPDPFVRGLPVFWWFESIKQFAMFLKVKDIETRVIGKF
jgi:hypothetical protein